MKNKFDILFEQIMNENSLFDVKEKIKSINNLDDSERTPENSAELPVAGQDTVVEEFNKRLEAVKTAISYPWLKKPYEGIYNELSKYNKKIILYKNDKQLLTQINYTIFQVLGPDPSNKYVFKRKENKVSFSIWKECLKKTDEIVLAVKEYPYFKLSYLAICLNTLFNKTVSTSYINWFESCIENAKKLLSAMTEKPVWFDLDKYIKKLDELKNKKDTDENWVNTVEITDEIRDNYFIDYGYMNSWQQDDNDKYHTAYMLHNRDKKEHPELHDGPHIRKNGRSDETTYCSCGFSHSVDSSD